MSGWLSNPCVWSPWLLLCMQGVVACCTPLGACAIEPQARLWDEKPLEDRAVTLSHCNMLPHVYRRRLCGCQRLGSWSCAL
jgi:hypothetical protein